MEEISADLQDGVATISINRPHVLNALNESSMRTITELVANYDVDPRVRVLVFTGEGDRAFCSGRDLKERAAADHAGQPVFNPMRAPHRNLFEAVWDFRKPTIAAVNGDAIGAGFELALACDLKIAAKHARFALPEAKRGMGAVFGATVLSRAVPSSIYFEWTYLGEMVSAEEAARWGVVNRVTSGEPMTHVQALAQEIIQRSPVSLSRMKATLIRGRELPVAAALRAEFHPDPYTSEDRIEGVRAFVEKRQPNWQEH